MNQEIKERWIAELESGNWEQANGVLAEGKSNKRCCLGILCDIAVADGIVETDGTRETWSCAMAVVYRGPSENSVGTTAVLPEEVMEWAELDTDNGTYNAGCNSLSADNDQGISFIQIAQTIREKF